MIFLKMCIYKMIDLLDIKRKSNSNRDGSVDLLRAAGIIFMIMGHVGFTGVFDKWIHGFHMPLWFIISGYFLTPLNVSERKTSDYIKGKFKGILLPYILFGGDMKLYQASREIIIGLGLCGQTVYALL